MSGFAVALTAPAADPLSAAAFLSARPGFSLRSASDYQRRNPGFLGRALTLEAAAALRADAEAAGLSCALFPEEDIKAPPRPLTASRVRLGNFELSAETDGAVVRIKYAEIAAFSAAAYDAPPPAGDRGALSSALLRRILGTAGIRLPPPVPGPGPRETYFRADIVTAAGSRLLLRPENLDFSGLEGRSSSSLENLRLLLTRLTGEAPGALRGIFLERFLSREDLVPLKLSGPEAADLELARLLLLRPAPAAGRNTHPLPENSL